MAGGAAPTLFLIAGPNGAGKSTLYKDRIAPITRAPFVNADEIERAWRDEGRPYSDPYAASRSAARWRDELLAAGRSFVTETVFSHESKLELVHRAKAMGYRVVLYHVHVREPAFCLARVAARVHEGGHDVPEERIRARYARNQPLIREAARIADITQVYDNSKAGFPPRFVLALDRGQVSTIADAPVPLWAARLYLD